MADGAVFQNRFHCKHKHVSIQTLELYSRYKIAIIIILSSFISISLPGCVCMHSFSQGSQYMYSETLGVGPTMVEAKDS